MRRFVLLLLPLLAVVLASPVGAAGSDATSARARSASDVSVPRRVTTVSADQGALDIYVNPTTGPSTRVAIRYRVENGVVVESTACIGQLDNVTNASAWGCGSFPLSALTIRRKVASARLAPVNIPVERCDASGACVSDTASVSASLSSVPGSYLSQTERTQSWSEACNVVTTTHWESTAGVGTLTIDGATWPIEAPDVSDGEGADPAITRSPSTIRTIC